jgi:hypothetical protein
MSKKSNTMKVTLCQYRFIPAILSGAKTQTIRPIPKRPQDWPKVGDLRSLRRWTGKPYRSPQEEIMRVVVTKVENCAITSGVCGCEIRIDGFWLTTSKLRDFAKDDGFGSLSELFEWFQKTHNIIVHPFTGIVIHWRPL